MPSTTSSSFSSALPSSTVITPSLPTLSIASAMILPIDSSALAEIAPTCAISLLVVQGLEIFFSSSTTAIDRLVDAALQVHRVHAGGDGLHAFADDRLGEHGGGGGAVAGDVGGLGSDFLHHLRAHVLELVLELDFLRDRDAVLGDGRGAEASARARRCGPSGPSVTLTALARMFTPFTILRGRRRRNVLLWLPCVDSPEFVRLAGDGLHSTTPMMSSSRMTRQLVALDLDGLAGVLAEQDRSPTLTSSGTQLAVCRRSCPCRRRRLRPGRASRRRCRE